VGVVATADEGFQRICRLLLERAPLAAALKRIGADHQL
jgi:hypothetical protein